MVTCLHCAGDKCTGKNLKDNQFLCANGEVLSGCGPSRGYRVGCPPNLPFLCARKNDCGSNEADQCCKSNCLDHDGIAACPTKAGDIAAQDNTGHSQTFRRYTVLPTNSTTRGLHCSSSHQQTWSLFRPTSWLSFHKHTQQCSHLVRKCQHN